MNISTLPSVSQRAGVQQTYIITIIPLNISHHCHCSKTSLFSFHFIVLPLQLVRAASHPKRGKSCSAKKCRFHHCTEMSMIAHAATYWLCDWSKLLNLSEFPQLPHLKMGAIASVSWVEIKYNRIHKMFNIELTHRKCS